MARPKKLTLDFFVHSANARHDRRIKSLRRREKNDGYATYYILLEMSCSENEMKLHLNDEITVEEVVEECGLTESSHFYRIVNSCVSVGLFNKQLWDSQKIVFSDDLYNSYIDRLEDRKASAERKQRFSEAKSLQDKIDEVTQENQVVTQENQVVTQENQVVTQDGTPEYRVQNYRTTELQTTEEKKEKKEEKDAETFFSDSPNSNQAMQQELNPANSANKQDPAPLPPAPLSDAAIALKAKFEAKFDRKANKYEPQGLTIAGYGEWHLGDRYNNWKPSLIAVAQKRKHDLSQDESAAAACDFIYNMARDCYREKHWGKFENLTAAAIAYEKALASNPTIKQSQDSESPKQDPYMPQVGEIDSNGMMLMADCRWEYFYPKLGRFSRDTGEAQVIWGMDNTHPPDPVDERCLKFLAKTKDNPERLAKLLTAKHLADSDFASYGIQAGNFLKAKDSLITALNQEIQKLLSSQAA